MNKRYIKSITFLIILTITALIFSNVKAATIENSDSTDQPTYYNYRCSDNSIITFYHHSDGKWGYSGQVVEESLNSTITDLIKSLKTVYQYYDSSRKGLYFVNDVVATTGLNGKYCNYDRKAPRQYETIKATPGSTIITTPPPALSQSDNNNNTSKELSKKYTYKCNDGSYFTFYKYKDNTWGGSNSVNSATLTSELQNLIESSKPIYKYPADDGRQNFSWNEFTGPLQTITCNSYQDSSTSSSSSQTTSDKKTQYDDEDNYKKVTADCEGLIGGGDFIKWVQWAFNLIKIIGPVLALVLGMVDFIKAATSGEDDAKKKAIKDVKNRIIAAALLFFIPSIIQLILSLVPGFTGNQICGIK